LRSAIGSTGGDWSTVPPREQRKCHGKEVAFEF